MCSSFDAVAAARALCAAFALLLWAAPAQADKRVALVIGNSAYRNAPSLINPTNDAADMGAVLERLGFSVRTITNATYDDMRRGLLEFGRNVRDADIAVIFFAGHGLEVGGENWLVPIDAELKSDIDVDREAMGLHSLLPAVENARKLGLVILDACRNNPFLAKMQRTIRTRAVYRGLASVEPSGNVLVAYAAKDGTTAADGEGRNSPFTASLLKYVETPGLEINFLFRNVRDDVIKATRREQQPFIYGSLSSAAIYLKDGPPPQLVLPQPPAGPGPDEITWGFLKDTSDPGALKRFVEQYPRSPYRGEAERRIAFLIDIQQADQQATEQRMAALAAEATAAKQAAAANKATPAGPAPEEVAWGLVQNSTDANQFRLFLDKFPASSHRADAARRVSEIAAEQRAAVLAMERRVAALSAEPEKPNPPVPVVDTKEIARSLQLELRRVGCFDGAVNGEFNTSSRDALRRFGKLASVSLPAQELSNETLKAIRGVDKRVCPLACKSGERAEGERCIRVGCPAGEVLRNGSCVEKEREPKARRAERAPEPRHKPAAGGGSRGGGKCFAFNGKSFCE